MLRVSNSSWCAALNNNQLKATAENAATMAAAEATVAARMDLMLVANDDFSDNSNGNGDGDSDSSDSDSCKDNSNSNSGSSGSNSGRKKTIN
jgi:hypothetical protein